VTNPENVGMMRKLAEEGNAKRVAQGAKPWSTTEGTAVEEVWGEHVPEWWKLLSSTSPGIGINPNIGIANKGMAETLAGKPYSGIGAMYPANARKAMAKVLKPAEKPLGNPKTFTMEMMQNADISPFDTLRFWEKMMQAPEAGFTRAPGLASHVEFQRGLRNAFPTGDPRWPGVREFTEDLWAGVPSKASGAPVAVEMEKRIQRAMQFEPPKSGKGPWTKRATPITRQEVIDAFRRGDAWAVALFPAVPAAMRQQNEETE
jgi:hypothetical protein